MEADLVARSFRGVKVTIIASTEALLPSPSGSPSKLTTATNYYDVNEIFPRGLLGPNVRKLSSNVVFSPPTGNLINIAKSRIPSQDPSPINSRILSPGSALVKKEQTTIEKDAPAAPPTFPKFSPAPLKRLFDLLPLLYPITKDNRALINRILSLYASDDIQNMTSKYMRSEPTDTEIIKHYTLYAMKHPKLYDSTKWRLLPLSAGSMHLATLPIAPLSLTASVEDPKLQALANVLVAVQRLTSSNTVDTGMVAGILALEIPLAQIIPLFKKAIKNNWIQYHDANKRATLLGPLMGDDVSSDEQPQKIATQSKASPVTSKPGQSSLHSTYAHEA